MLKFVVDTNILISRLLVSSSIPAKAVSYILNNGYILLSKEVITEIEDVLFRPKFDKYISREARILFIEGLEAISLKIEINQTIEHCRDLKDNKILELAICGNADYVITGDNDLLSMKEFQNIPIITPKFFLEIVNFK